MAANTTIGIIYRPSDWTGGVYYILNFMIALRHSEECKTKIILFCDSEKDFNFIRDQTRYPDLEMHLIPLPVKLNSLKLRIDQWLQKWRGRPFFAKRYLEPIDLIFPYSYDEYFIEISNKVYWLPDLQDKFYPDFFDEKTVQARDTHYRKLAESNQVVVFSSRAALEDYSNFYSGYKFKPVVLHFASFYDRVDIQDEDFLKKKYNLNNPFFYSPNQFWQHKNHQVVIEAASLLKKSGKPFTVIFSGNENDPRSPGYVSLLKEMVKEKGLENEIRFLGFIDRSDVFGLMKISSAVIQPSKFEGWSTVVEDALSMNAFLLLADLKVNHEQIDRNVLYFHPEDSLLLSQQMELVLENKITHLPFDYSIRRKSYTKDICNFIQYVSSK